MARRKRRLASRARHYLRALLAFLFSNVGVVVLVVAYTIAGAFMFQAIEGASEMERVNNMTRERDITAQYLWQNATLTYNMFNETALKESINEELTRYQATIVRAARRGWDGARSSRQWSFSSAFLYSLTVITTIGYGHLSPRTSWGKIVTIFYALLGMPLFLLYLSNVGELLASWFKCIYALICLCRGCPGFSRRRIHVRPQLEFSEAESIERPVACETDYAHSDITAEYRISVPTENYYSRSRAFELESEFSYIGYDVQTITVPISVCVAFMVGYIMFGSMIFGLWEKWDKLDGAYFCFISLSSIGFGDFVPGERVYTPRIEASFIVCSLYLTLGMALVAMCFNLMQMLGVWYVIQKTSTASHCITYNFTKTDEPGRYQLEQLSQHFILGLTPLKHDYRYSGVLTVSDSAIPARMKVNFPLSVAGSASYTIMATDYTQYAAIFTCQKLAFAHRRSATILSRSKELDKMFLDKMRAKLSSYGVDPYDLSIISQTDCPKHPNGTANGVNINIDPNTFSSHNIGEAVRKTGSAIADGVEYVVDAGKKVYHKVASSKEDLTESPDKPVHALEGDAEWLP